MTKLLARVALLAALCVLAGTSVFAQLQSGRILGTVFDPQRAGIPGATVTVTNIATNIARTTQTDAEGNYVITPLDPGNYRVSAEIAGFQTAVREGLTLTVGQSSRVELTLNLGGLSTEVQVVAETPLLNTESATLSEVITNEQIVDLPLNGRGFHELARLTSGVALLPPTGNTQPVRPEVVNGNVIGGVAGSQTRFLLDGVDITEEHQGGTWIQTSVDALQEFSVSAERVFRRVPRRRRHVQRDDEVRRQRVSWEPVRVHAERRVRLEELLRREQGEAGAQPVRRHARRPGHDPRLVRRAKQDLLLCELRRASAGAGCCRRHQRAVGRAATRRFPRPRANFRSADDRHCRWRQHAHAVFEQPHSSRTAFRRRRSSSCSTSRCRTRRATRTCRIRSRRSMPIS